MPQIHKILGPPGTGKTTYLIGIVEQELANSIMPDEIIYTSFTRAAAFEARDRALLRFPKYVKSDFPWFSTIHSICFRLLSLSRTDVFSGKQVKEFCAAYSYKLSSENQSVSEEVDSDIPHMVLSTTADYYEHFISWMRNMTLPYPFALQRFCGQPGLPQDFNPGDLKIYINRRNDYKAEKHLFDFTDMIELTISNGLVPPATKVMIADEQQDVSPLLAKLLDMWSDKMERVFLGGDPYQAVYCVPVGTKITGASDKLIEDVVSDDVIIAATGSGHTDTRRVVYTSSHIYDGNLVQITTQSGKQLRVTPEHTLFWNWKWSWLDDNKNDGLGWWYVYLMKMGDRWRIGKTDNPAVRLRFEHGAEGILPIAAYKTEEEALAWEEIYSLRYGIPTTVFYHRGMHGLNSISQAAQDTIFNQIDSFGGAGRLLADLNKPWIGYIRPMAQTTAYSGIQRRYIHLLALHHDHTNFRRYIYWDFGVVDSQPGISGSKYLFDLQACRQFAEQKAQELDADVFEKWPFTDAHMYQPVPASNILPGCYVPVWDGEKIIDDLVINVEMVKYFGPVYDLQIGLYNNFIADGIFVHNCFMGADPSILIKAKADQSIVLKQSYRCSPPIHEMSRKLVSRFGTRYTDDDFLPTKQQGVVLRHVPESIKWPDIKERTFYLHRTNWLLSQAYATLIEQGVPFGTTKGYLAPMQSAKARAINNAMQLSHGKDITITDLVKLMDLIPTKTDKGNFLKVGAKTEIKEQSGLKGGDLVNLKDLPNLGFEPLLLNYLTQDGILHALKLEKDERLYFTKVISKYGYGVLNSEPNILLSTIHGVKGREADTVILNLNLTHKTYDSMVNDPEPEHRLFYVGVTRAKTKLILLEPEDWESYRL